jgi:hypothetical protein
MGSDLEPARFVAFYFFLIPFLTSDVVIGIFEPALLKFDVSNHDLVLIDATLDHSVDRCDFHHFEAEVAELVRGKKCPVGPAEGHPRDARLCLQLRQKDELAFISFPCLKDVLKK